MCSLLREAGGLVTWDSEKTEIPTAFSVSVLTTKLAFRKMLKAERQFGFKLPNSVNFSNAL